MNYKIELTVDAQLTVNKLETRLRTLMLTWLTLDPNVDKFEIGTIETN